VPVLLSPLVHVHLTNAPGHGLITVRPDGYTGLRCQTADVNQLSTWLARRGVRTSGLTGGEPGLGLLGGGALGLVPRLL
jgi:hypothetical protein